MLKGLTAVVSIFKAKKHQSLDPLIHFQEWSHFVLCRYRHLLLLLHFRWGGASRPLRRGKPKGFRGRCSFVEGRVQEGGGFPVKGQHLGRRREKGKRLLSYFYRQTGALGKARVVVVGEGVCSFSSEYIRVGFW